ncbi:MAG: Gfo/Idh/MocA family oxidoreductase [Opitutaceae bacterium]
MSRRTFIKTAAAAAAIPAVLPNVLRAQGEPGPAAPAILNEDSKKLRVACIGVGGRGWSAVEGMKDENVVALCDVDDERASGAFEMIPGALRYRDFRRMFDEIGSEIDAVTVSTPDHMHFAAAMAAIRLGKHVLVEKPLTHSIWEARQLTLAAREAGVVTQMGNQGHALEGTRLVREWIEAGAIGPVREVHFWTNRPIWPQGLNRPDHSTCIPVIPATLDWNLWLGVAPERPYDPAYVPFNWRGFWDFGTGALGDMACHIMDAAYWGLQLGAPTSVEAVSTSVNEESAPKASMITYQFPARGSMPPVKAVWHDGNLMPSLPDTIASDYRFDEGGGVFIIGDDATIVTNTYAGTVRIAPEARMQEVARAQIPRKYDRVKGGHFQEWIEACKGGPVCGSNFEYSGPFTETVLLGNLALRTRRRLEWDPVNLQVTNVPEANRFIKRDYRPGWDI